MKDFVKRMIDEHAQLVVRISKLHNYIYDGRGEQDEAHELANKCMQLIAMKQYANALECRLNNQGICYKNGEYLEVVGKIVTEDTHADNHLYSGDNNHNTTSCTETCDNCNHNSTENTHGNDHIFYEG